MSRLLILAVIITGTISCAQRGYNSLAQEVPELFPGFLAENYEKIETPNNIMYMSKTLSLQQKEKKEFYKENYVLKKKPNSYYYYTPNERRPASNIQFTEFNNWPTVQTIHTENEQALLID